MPHTVIIIDQKRRDFARRLIDNCPWGYHVTVSEPKRTLDQNDMLWPLLTIISAARPEGYIPAPPEVWRFRFLNSLNFDQITDIGLNGLEYSLPMSTSRLSKREFSLLLESVLEWGARHGIDLQDPRPPETEER